MVRAWRSHDRFEGRSSLRSWLYRIATNVCLDMLDGRKRRARPMDRSGRTGTVDAPLGAALPEHVWLQPMPDGRVLAAGGGPGRARGRTRVDPPRLRGRAAAPAAAPARRADPARGAALAGGRGRRAARHERRLGEQRAAAGAGHAGRQRSSTPARRVEPVDEAPARAARPLRRRVRALRHRLADVRCCTKTPRCRCRRTPLWLRGPDDIRQWMLGLGLALPRLAAACRRWRTACRRSGSTTRRRTGGYEPWALQVLEISDGRITGLNSFLDTPALFPLFGLPLTLEAADAPGEQAADR